MFRPTVSKMIDQLVEFRSQYGDLEMVAYHEKVGKDLEVLDLELNIDLDPAVCLLAVAENE